MTGSLAAAEEFYFLREMVLVFTVGAALTYVCHRLKLVPIVGFLIAGVLIGPNALAVVRSAELIDGMAEVGIILLLFTIGVEFSLEKLARIRRFIVMGGGLQVGLSVALTFLVLAALGVGWRAGVYTGFLVALSSTAIVLKLFAYQGTTDTPVGRISLGVLIFQDLSVIAMVLLLPLLSGQRGSPIELAAVLARAVVIVVLVLVLARRVVPPLLDRVARVQSPELFLLTVVVICFGIAWITSLGGVSLSLGAFLAGLVVSESRFREHAVGEILPLRTLFNAVFFVSVGMLLDLGFVLANPLLVVVCAASVLVLKALVTAASVLLLRYPFRIAIGVSLALAQIGEFSFVLERAGRAEGLFPAGLSGLGDQTFLAVTVILMTATPLLVRLEPRLRRLGDRWDREGTGEGTAEGAASEPAPESALRDHVVVGGYGLAGRMLETTLGALSIPHVIVDLNPVSVLEAEMQGLPVVFGDLTRASTLERVAVGRARLVVIAINDLDAATRAVQRVKLRNPGTEVIARVQYGVDGAGLEEEGADVVVAEEMESAVRLVMETLHGCGVPREEIARQVERLRTRYGSS